MHRLTDFLGSYWFVITLLIAAGVGLIAILRSQMSDRHRPIWALILTFTTALIAIGSLAVPRLTVEFLDIRLTLGQLLLLISFFCLLFAGLALAIARVWSFWIGLGIAAVALLSAGSWLVPHVTKLGVEIVKSVRGLEFVNPEWLTLLTFVPFAALVGTGRVNIWIRMMLASLLTLLVFLLWYSIGRGTTPYWQIALWVTLGLLPLGAIAFGWGIGRASLSGLGPTRKWTAITLRSLVVALLAMALAEPRIRRPSENVTVIFLVDRSYSVPQDLEPDKPVAEALDRRWGRVKYFIEQAVERRGPDRRNDQAALILFGRRPKLALPPSDAPGLPVDERMAGPIDGNYTDVAAAIKLALASFPEGTSKRIILVSDGNENLGNAEEQANIAKQNGVQIDVLALAPNYQNQSEVLVQAVEAPPVTSQGQRLPVRVLLRNASPDRDVIGRLEVLKSSLGENKPIEIEDAPDVLEAGQPPKVRLQPGLNVFRFRDRVDPLGDSAFAYRATFTPIESIPRKGGVVSAGLPGDRSANNRAAAAVVSRGQRRVLFLDENVSGRVATQHEHLIATLRRGRIRTDRLPAEKLPADKGELGVFLSNYDCIVLANVPYERFTQDQAEMIRSTVYDQGCGLIMIGGPDSFGAGGYQGTPIEAALPVDCEIKALKAAGKGGLVLIMHASEMADGNKWQKDIAKLAIQRLGPEDMVGVTQYGFGGNGVNWHIPFQRVGESDSESRRRLLSKVDSMMPGDMPDFDPFLRASVDTLTDPRHNLTVKHCILISDGDPNYSGPGQKAVSEMAEKGVTCTTVGVATHGGAEKSRLKSIASGTKDGDGKPGNFYDVTNPNQLPAIYIKESRRVSQSFIYKEPFTPLVVGGAGTSDVLAPELPNPLPKLYGFVRTTMKENILASMSLEGPTPYPDQRFPLLASWRYGLGKAVAFTSDARTQPQSETKWWDKDWAVSDMYQKFWEQAVTWAMREAERGKMTITTEYRDGRVRVTADIRDDKEKPVGGLTLKGAVTPPNPPLPGEKPPQVDFKSKGGGIYEAEFPAEEAGSYFVNVQALEAERDANGNLILNPDGTAKSKTFDAARAGVTVPYSPEFADLESNTPILRRIADMTDGQFHTETELDPQNTREWRWMYRDAPITTRALLPFWFWLVFTAGILLLFDVGVRRIAIEWNEIQYGATKLWASLRKQTEQVDDSAGLGRLLQRKAEVGAAIDRSRAARRFEASEATTEPAPAGADEYASQMPTAPTSSAQPVRRDEDHPVEEVEDTFAKLRKAKERARRQQQRDDDS